MGGERIEAIPYLAEDLKKAKPVYESMPGWKQATSSASRFEDLPVEAQNYIKRIETLLGVPVSMISLGPEREQTIALQDFYAVREMVQ